MLLDLKDSIIVIDKNPMIKDFRLNVELWQKAARLKFKIINIPGNNDDIDLALSWHLPSVTIQKVWKVLKFKAGMKVPPNTIDFKFDALELHRDIKFQGILSLDVMDKVLRIDVSYYNKETGVSDKINTKLSNLADLLAVIKTIITSTN